MGARSIGVSDSQLPKSILSASFAMLTIGVVPLETVVVLLHLVIAQAFDVQFCAHLIPMMFASVLVLS